MTILEFINELRKTDKYIAEIYRNGGCWRFHLLLSKMYPGAFPLINPEKDHICTDYYGQKFDINGVVSDGKWLMLTNEDLGMVAQWSFSRTKALKIGECPHCEEPIVA